MIDLKEERRTETEIIENINKDLEKILKSDDFVKSYSINPATEERKESVVIKSESSMLMGHNDTEVIRGD